MKRNLVYVVGLGPGDPQFLTAQAKTALENADVLCGYTVYIDLIRSFYPEKEVHATGMTKEIDRCRWALETAQSGKTVALVCSGDAGVYGMAVLDFGTCTQLPERRDRGHSGTYGGVQRRCGFRRTACE